jgi:hypothetical protein
MFANFYNGLVHEQKIARARERLQEAMDYGTWDHEMRHIRNVLSRTRLKLKASETAYLLVSLAFSVFKSIYEDEMRDDS